MYTKFKDLVGEVQGIVGPAMTAVVFPETVGHDGMQHAFLQGKIVGGGFGHLYIGDHDVKVSL